MYKYNTRNLETVGKTTELLHVLVRLSIEITYICHDSYVYLLNLLKGMDKGLVK